MPNKIIILQQSGDDELLNSSERLADASSFFECWCEEHPRTSDALMRIMMAHPTGDFTVRIPPYGDDVTPPMPDEEMLRLAGNIRPAFFSDELRDS